MGDSRYQALGTKLMFVAIQIVSNKQLQLRLQRSHERLPTNYHTGSKLSPDPDP